MSNLPPYPGGNEDPDGEPGQPDGGASEPSWGATPPQPPHGEQQTPPPPPSPYGQQPPPRYGQQPGGQQPPYGQTPYGQTPYGQTPYGQTPYGQGQWGGGAGGYGSYQGPNDATGQSYSGLAIAALVLSFTCVLSWLGVILGIAAIFRTGKGKAKGLWMAVTAIIVGLILTGILALIVAGALFIRGNVIGPDNAEAGQCVETDEEDDEVFMWKLDCGDDHDAEIVGTREVPRAGFGDDQAFDACAALVADEFPEFAAREAQSYDLHVLWDSERPSKGDHYLCYIEPRDGSKMTEQILG